MASEIQLAEATAGTKLIVLDVEGMMCMKSCGTTVQNALQRVAGVAEAKVVFEEREARIVASQSVNVDDLVEAVEMVGFEATVKAMPVAAAAATTVKIHVDGMMCQNSCGSTVQAALQAVPGVQTAVVDFATETATVTSTCAMQELIDAIEIVGFDASPMAASDTAGAATEVKLSVAGMSCMKGCGSKVVAALQGTDGVASATLDFPTKIATVQGTASPETLIAAVQGVGFSATLQSAPSASATGPLTVEPKQQQQQQKKKKTTKKKVAAAGAPHQRMATPVAAGAGAGAGIGAGSGASPSNMLQVHLSVSGMTCASCVRKVETSLAEVAGVLDVTVALLTEQAEVRIDADVVAPDAIARHVTELGYEAELLSATAPGANLDKATFAIDGMTCSSCVGKIQRMLEAMPGVHSAAVALTTSQARIEYDGKLVGARTILEAIEELGYSAQLVDENEEVESMEAHQAAHLALWQKRIIASACLVLPTIIIHMVFMPLGVLKSFFGMQVLLPNLKMGILILWALATPMQFWIGKPFYVSAWKGLKHRSMGMDFLIVTGTTIAYVYSVAAVIAGALGLRFGQSFFETSGMLLGFVVMGKYLETRAKGKVSGALSALMRLAPSSALLLTPVDQGASATGTGSHASAAAAAAAIAGAGAGAGSGASADVQYTEAPVALSLVQKGDILKVVPGGKIPVDGIVIRGSCSVDESMLTGESMAVDKAPGDFVFGSTVCQDGTLYVQASAVGKDTALSQIVALVRDAQTRKAPIEKLADTIAGYFAPIVVLLAVGDFLLWYIVCATEVMPHSWLADGHDCFVHSLLFAVSVVVIACPCALGLATPTAVMVGTTVGAKNGILIKGAEALEKAHNISTIVFDKTGTLTTGKPSFSGVIPLGDCAVQRTTDELLSIIGSAESSSEHPIALACVAAAKAQGAPLVTPNDFKATAGRGLECTVFGGNVLLGNAGWMEENGLPVSQQAQDLLRNFEEQGHTAMYLAVDAEVVAVFAVRDTIKDGAAATVTALKKLGLEVWMITGDAHGPAQAIAHEAGIENFKAQVLPNHKASAVQQLQAGGKQVAMVGDGVNDSPALAAADLGVAIGAGSDIAVEAASVVLVRSDITDVVAMVDLSKRVFSRIKWNMFWAMGYNLLGIPIAGGLLFPFFGLRLPPELAALAMALSSVSVVASSLMLRRYKRPDIMADHKRSVLKQAKKRSRQRRGKRSSRSKNTLTAHPGARCPCIRDKGYCDCGEDCQCDEDPLLSPV